MDFATNTHRNYMLGSLTFNSLLHVDKFFWFHDDGVRYKVVFDGRVNLNDVASLPPHVQIMNGLVFQFGGTAPDFKRM